MKDAGHANAASNPEGIAADGVDSDDLRKFGYAQQLKRSMGAFSSFAVSFSLISITIGIFACGVASMASTTRLIFSMARDNMLPLSGLLKRVHPGRQAPVCAIVVVWLITSSVVLGLEKLALITSISTTASYLGYGGIILASFRAPKSGVRTGAFSLGRWSVPIAATALIWTGIVVGALTIPKLDGARLAAWSTLVGIAVGGALYLALIRNRIAQGQAGPPTNPEMGVTEESQPVPAPGGAEK